MSAPPHGLRLYTAEEAAPILRVKPSWMKTKAREGEIPFTMLGGSYRWTAGHLAEIVQLFERRPEQAPASTPRRRSAPADPTVQPLRARRPARRRAS